VPIRVLPPDVAAKIAAGEVVERPASVIKELVENAIDAGARSLQVDISQGGRRLMRVADDGCGIPADEVALAVARNATSKLHSADDLYRIRTLGFRGEALASIAAVSRLTLSTRAAGEAVGALIRVEGGALTHREPHARPPGTTVQVENLFFNTPARLKFLRADPTEAGHIARLIASYALAFPGLRYVLQHNDRLVLRTTGTGRLEDALLAIYGLDVLEQMIPLQAEEREEEGVRVWGYVGSPGLQRADRRDVLFFVNGRWIQDRSLAYAVSEAYRTLLPQGRHPLAVLHIALPPEDVDVNIHPTKQEVRFRHDRLVFTAVQRAVRTTLMAHYPVASLSVSTGTGGPWAPGGQGARGGLSPTQAQMALDAYRTGTPPRADRESPFTRPQETPTERLPMLRVLGQIAQTYLIAEGPGGLYLIDQHAAHERIRYEDLADQKARGQVASQELLEPLAIELSPQQAGLLEGRLELLAGYGLEIIPFGGSTYLVKRIPSTLAGGATARDVPAALAEMLDAAERGGEAFSWEEQALITLSCHTAIRAGQTLSLDEMRDLVRKLERCQLPHTCPHGRPTMLHISQAQLEREFGRQ